MGGSYQSDKPSGGGRPTLAITVWLLLSPLLFWSPTTRVTPWVQPEVLAAAAHLLWFLLGAVLVMRTRRTSSPLSAWFLLVLVGAVFEAGQSWVVGRQPSWLDVALNAIGAALGCWLFGPRKPGQRQLR